MLGAINQAVTSAGGNAKFAEFLGVHPSFVSQLITGRRLVPYKYCQSIEDCFGISKHDLRPDVFGENPVSKKKGAA